MTNELTENSGLHLPESQQKELQNEISSFLNWIDSLGIKKHAEYNFVYLEKEAKEDWVMWVKDPDSKTVSFNTYMASKCTFEYFVSVVLHECFHLFVHDIPNKSDAKRLRDDFGDVAMRVLDIEADFYVAEYFRYKKNYSLENVFRYFHEGSRIFGDPSTRIGKLERFVGSVLSISNASLRKIKPGTRKIFLPTVQNILTEQSMNVLIIDEKQFNTSTINATVKDFQILNRIYTEPKNLDEYVEQLIAFSRKALKISDPKHSQPLSSNFTRNRLEI